MVITPILAQTNFVSTSFPAPNGKFDAGVVSEFEQAKKTFKDFRVESVEEFARIKHFRQNLLAQGTPTHHFTLKNGDFVQCIEANSQPALKQLNINLNKVHVPEFPDSKPNAERLNEMSASFGMDGSTDPEGNVRRCPDGSVPRLVPSLEELCRTKAFSDNLRKGRPPLPPKPVNQIKQKIVYEAPSEAGHEYATEHSSVPNQGAKADFNTWNPWVQESSELSLAQLWVISTSGAQLQTVEAGWIVYPDLNGDSKPHIFSYYTLSDYSEHPRNYNGVSGKFMQYGPRFIPGIAVDDTSTFGQRQAYKSIGFYHDPVDSNWWLLYDGQPVGFYPGSLFDPAGLGSHADIIEFGGEIVNNETSGKHTTTEMGSGQFPSEGTNYGAYIKRLSYFDTNFQIQQANNFVKNNSPGYYDVAVASSSDPNWGQFMLYGGGPYYSVTDLGNLGGSDEGGSTYTVGSAINNSNQVAGYSLTPTGHYHGFIYSNGVMSDIDNVSDRDSFPAAINNSGQVVGQLVLPDNQGAHAFFFGNGHMTDLGTLIPEFPSFAVAITDAGQLVGQSTHAEAEPKNFISDGVGMSQFVTPVDSIPQYYPPAIIDINNHGHTLWVYRPEAAGEKYRGCIYDGTTTTDLGNLSPESLYFPTSMNDKDQAVGFWNDENGLNAFLSYNGQMTRIGSGHPTSINKNEQIVGYDATEDDYGERALIYLNKSAIDLNTMIAPNSSWYLFTANGINDAGNIVAGAATNLSSTVSVLLRKGKPDSLTGSSNILGLRLNQEQGILKLLWNSSPGITWQVQNIANLANGNWFDFGDPVTAIDEAVTVSVPLSNGQQFFRVIPSQ